MSSSRPRRSTQATVSGPRAPTSAASNRRSRPSRGSKVEPEVDEDAEGEDDDEEEEPAAGPSRKSRAPSRPSIRGRTKTEEREQDDAEGDVGKARRNRKSVSYREVPVEEADEEDEEDGDLTDNPDVEDDGEADEAVSPQATGTPSKRRRRNPDDDIEMEDKPNRFEKVGSGRGGFSVKGAAAAAARARWAKVRLAKAERGDEDDGEPRKKGRIIRRENKAAVEKLKDGEVITIRGVDYVAMNDELPLPDDPKGEAKIDELGRLKGDREYKIFTFTSEGRENTERLYGLTIDVARACGFVDSLAFLRRFPVIQKLQCQPGEAEMLIEVGRVAGNMKHRMVTIVPMRNVFKMMGARIVKDGKWVTDDYYEDESLAQCAELGRTPYGPAIDQEIAGHSTRADTRGERERDALTSTQARNHLQSSFYTIGGPSTHFGGTGIDPWTEGGHGHRHARMRAIGVSAEDWMYVTAQSCREVDAGLKRYRDERVGMLEGKDLDGWVWTAEAGEKGKAEIEVEKQDTSGDGLKPPTMDRQRSGLSREVTFEPEVEADATANADLGIETEQPGAAVPTPTAEVEQAVLDPLLDAIPQSDGGELRIETPAEAEARSLKWARGGGSWVSGRIMASYEPHTHMPHVPLYTQPSIAEINRISPYPILQSFTDPQHQNFIQSTVRGKAAKGLASIEYVFDARGPVIPDAHAFEAETRLRIVQEAEEWEKRGREAAKLARGRNRGVSAARASIAPTPTPV